MTFIDTKSKAAQAVAPRMLDKIRKLFAMSQDSSEQEAETALRQMNFLMKEHGLTEKDLETSEFGQAFTFEGQTLPKWMSFLSLGIAAMTNTVVTIERDELFQKVKRVIYKGYDQDVQAAIMLSDYLHGTQARCLKEYKRLSYDNSKAGATSFSNAFALTLQRRMVEIAEQNAAESPMIENQSTSSCTSLVVKKMAMVEAEFGKQRIKRHRSSVSSYSASNAGSDAGRKVSLNRQVTGNAQKRLA